LTEKVLLIRLLKKLPLEGRQNNYVTKSFHTRSGGGHTVNGYPVLPTKIGGKNHKRPGSLGETNDTPLGTTAWFLGPWAKAGHRGAGAKKNSNEGRERRLRSFD